MAIIIHKNVDNPGALTTTAQLVLELIPEGSRWFELSSQPAGPAFHFDSEKELLVAVLDGLHSSELVYLPPLELLVDPEKLMTLSQKDLQSLVDCVKTGKSKRHCHNVLKKAGLLTNKVLKQSIEKFLHASEQAKDMLFQMNDLSSSLALYELANDEKIAPEPMGLINIDAANYAVAKAQTIVQFCDYYRFYMQVMDEFGLAYVSPQARQKQFSNVYNALVPFAHESLVCPQISGLMDAQHINQSINTWLEYNGSFGFSSFSNALVKLSQNISLDNLDKEQLTQEVQSFKEKIHDFLRTNEVEEPTLSQDGKTLNYTFAAPNPRVIFSLDQKGCLSLAEFSYQPTSKSHNQTTEDKNAEKQTDSNNKSNSKKTSS